jgi:predicted acetylornithine/succinylornithine family transaminase
MADLNSLSLKEKEYFFNTYKRLNILIERGEGCFLYTSTGEKILDMFGGLAVNVLGYNHPALNKAIESQIKKYIHISNFFYQENQILLAEKILKLSGLKKIFFTNSGTEAVEAAIKIIRKYFKGTNKKELVSFTGSFHGRTMGALSLTVRKKYQEDFEPLLSGVKTADYNSVSSLEKTINENTGGVFIECIQGEGGINIANDDFVKKLAELRDKFGFLIVVDEIQSGVGRTGKLHSYEHYGLIPDLVLIAKGMGGGLPLGAVLGAESVANVLTQGSHGTTFGGNPVAAACGLAVFNEVEKGLMENVRKKGEYILSKLNELKVKYPEKIKDVRGKGMMIGIELKFDGQAVVEQLIKQNVLVNCTNGNVIRLLPPLIISEREIDTFIFEFDKAIELVHS